MNRFVTTSTFLAAFFLLFTAGSARAQTFESGSLDDYDWQLRNNADFDASTSGGITDAVGGSDGDQSVEVTNDTTETNGELINDAVQVSAGDTVSFDVLVPQEELDNFTFEYIQPFVQCDGFSQGAFPGGTSPQDFTGDQFMTLSVGVPDDFNCGTSTSRVGIQIVHSDSTQSPTMYVDNIRNQDGEFLPVELASFDAVVSGNDVTLHWRTASETKNAGFEVEQRFQSGAWEQVGYVEGHGTTTLPQTYSHSLVNLPVGHHAFRLRQVDYDGDHTYSSEVEATITSNGSYTLSSPYPNPARARTRFTLAVSQEQAVRVEVFNTLGQRVKVLHDGLLEAKTAHPFALEAGDLASGVYFVRAYGESFTASRQVVLIR